MSRHRLASGLMVIVVATAGCWRHGGGGGEDRAGPSSADAGGGACEVQANACVHQGGDPAYCCAVTGTSINAERMCVENRSKTYFCYASQGCGFIGVVACYERRGPDGGVQEYVIAPHAWESRFASRETPCADATLATRFYRDGFSSCDLDAGR